ncbi:MAG: (Fe-S)-binding protein [Phycisphaerae bacterium]
MNPTAMALLLVVGWGVFAYSANRRWKLMRVGTEAHRFDRPGRRVRSMLKYAFAQFRMRRYPISGMAHTLVFVGFLVLLLRSLMLWGRGFDETFDLGFLDPHGRPGQVYGLLKDFFAVLVTIGALIFFYYRVAKKLPRLTHNTEAIVILVIIIVMMGADILYDGAERAYSIALIRYVQTYQHTTDASPASDARRNADSHYEHPPLARARFDIWEPAGSVAAMGLQSLPPRVLHFLYHAGFWTHSALVLIFLNLLPYSKHFHVITAIPNVYLQNLDPPGKLPNLEDIEGKLEREETLGIKRIDQFSWKSILDLYTCTECGRCSDHCPAANTGKKLSPKHFTIDLRDFLYRHEATLVAAKAGGGEARAPEASAAQANEGDGSDGAAFEDLAGSVIDPEVLWACTSCRACEQECPVFITYVDKIVDMRRYLVQEKAEFPAELQTAFRGLETNANPWNFSSSDRAAWADGLDIKTLAEHPEAEVLFWVGCAPSFDERAKKVTRATVTLLKRAGVDFAILGQEEQCTGDPARRAGNEFLFQMLAQANVEVLSGYGVEKKKIVTTCPHCFNTLLNEYPDFGGHYEVIHHTTFLEQLIREGKLKPVKAINQRVAYHDSCYLGRHNEVYDAPREALKAIPGVTLVEPQETRDRGMCCGAGGAQMFKEEEPGDERVNVVRTKQLLDAGPDAISSACPFCMRMLTDGLAAHDKEEMPQLDIAEMLLESVMEEAAEKPEEAETSA